MFIANPNYAVLPESYLFSEVARRIREFKESNPEADVVRMDIGDVSLPLPEIVVRAIQESAQDMGNQLTFHGYGPEQGYDFLREKIALQDYIGRGLTAIEADDIFISDGAKSDLGNITDLFGPGVKIAVAEPAYPVYVDSNVLSGRGGEFKNGQWSNIIYLECKPENNFCPSLPEEVPDVIYLCYPNNPTGAAMSKDELSKWIEYAAQNNSLLIYDSAYEAYVKNPSTVRSVYEVDGAEKVAIEIRSFSKTAGFTGVRCGYTVVPRSLKFTFPDGSPASLNKMWLRRQTTKFNGVGYIIQKAAEALYTPQGREAVRNNVSYYMENAKMLRETLLSKGWKVVGGEDSPYIWANPNPEGKYIRGESLTSWQIFQHLLEQKEISSTPGVGFGASGEGWIRLTGFNTRELTLKAIERLKTLSF